MEALNFSVQTVTTVGYSNWMPAGVSPGDPRVFWVKVISLPTMLAGAALFTITIAILVEMFKA